MNKLELPKIKTCNKICGECGFTKDGTTDTLYNEAYNIIENAIIFPCHMYLKSKTGSENQGTETLNEIHVCRGYVAFMVKNYALRVSSSEIGAKRKIWDKLFSEIEPSELDNICSLDELENRHIGLREKINMR